MRLGDDSNFLEVIDAPSAGMPGIYAVRARVTDSLSELSVRNDAVVFDGSESTWTGFVAFRDLKSQSCVLPIGGGGSITLSRDLRGAIAVRYRIPSFEIGATLEGSIHVSGEFSMSVLREIASLIQR